MHQQQTYRDTLFFTNVRQEVHLFLADMKAAKHAARPLYRGV
jgi:hypothetical protein